MTELQESGALAATKKQGRKYRARLIAGDQWGSCGFYPKNVLESDGATTFPQGTAVYLDHPGHQESMDRPERSVRDLAGKITSTPVYENDGLYADIEFYSHAAPIIEALWEDVGMSIRASGTTETGEAAGRQGQIITSLSEGLSVDVVTKAGAGGKLVALLESARHAPLLEATANEKRERLQAVVKNAHGQFEKTYTFVRDFDDAHVYFEVETPSDSKTYQQAYTENQDDSITLTGTPVEVVQTTVYRPANASVAPSNLPAPAGQESATNKQEEHPMGDISTGRVNEAQGQNDQNGGQGNAPQKSAEALQAENERLKAQISSLQQELAKLKQGGKQTEAARIYTDAFREAGAEAPDVATALAEAAAAGDDDLDIAALTESARTQAAQIAAAQGKGTPKNMGDTTPIHQVQEADSLPTFEELQSVKGA